MEARFLARDARHVFDRPARAADEVVVPSLSRFVEGGSRTRVGPHEDVRVAQVGDDVVDRHPREAVAALGEKVDDVVDRVVAPDLAKQSVHEESGARGAQAGLPQAIDAFVLPFP